MNKNFLKLLEKFANEAPWNEHIKVTINEHSHEYKPRDGHHAYYDHCNLLHDMINGAQSFLWYLEREGYDIVRKSCNKK